jgi:hypothetical protein
MIEKKRGDVEGEDDDDDDDLDDAPEAKDFDGKDYENDDDLESEPDSLKPNSPTNPTNFEGP